MPGRALDEKMKGDDDVSQIYTAQELANLLNVSESKAYKLIKQMNEELEEKGFLTIRGKIPVAYVQERFFFGVSEEQAS